MSSSSPPDVLDFFNSHVFKQRAVWTFPAALTTANFVCSETSSKPMSFRVEPCAGLNPRAGIGKNALSPAWPHRVEGERALPRHYDLRRAELRSPRSRADGLRGRLRHQHVRCGGNLPGTS